MGPQCIDIGLALGPYLVNLSLNGKSNVGAFLGHWHTACKVDAHYPRTFAADIGGSINTFHYGKATTCEDSFGGLLRSLSYGLEALAIEHPELKTPSVARAA